MFIVCASPDAAKWLICLKIFGHHAAKSGYENPVKTRKSAV